MLSPTAPVASANCCVCISTVALRETGWLLPVPRLLLDVTGLPPLPLPPLLSAMVVVAAAVLAASACFSTEQ